MVLRFWMWTNQKRGVTDRGMRRGIVDSRPRPGKCSNTCRITKESDPNSKLYRSFMKSTELSSHIVTWLQLQTRRVRRRHPGMPDTQRRSCRLRESLVRKF